MKTAKTKAQKIEYRQPHESYWGVNGLEIIADNGGGLVIQTPDYIHYYNDPKQAAEDFAKLANGEDTGDWDGNFLDEDDGDFLVVSRQDEANGCYEIYSADDVLVFTIKRIRDYNGYAMRKFLVAFVVAMCKQNSMRYK